MRLSMNSDEFQGWGFGSGMRQGFGVRVPVIGFRFYELWFRGFRV